jgi:hypothetical protein
MTVTRSGPWTWAAGIATVALEVMTVGGLFWGRWFLAAITDLLVYCADDLARVAVRRGLDADAARRGQRSARAISWGLQRSRFCLAVIVGGFRQRDVIYGCGQAGRGTFKGSCVRMPRPCPWSG